jgi:molybdenum cofactor cytidylyltransferase
MGRPKQLLPFGDRTILERVVDTLLAAGVGEVIVVLGHLAEHVRTVLGHRPVQIVVNASYREGMLSSVKCGVCAVRPDQDAVLIALGDQPHIDSAVVRELIEQYSAGEAGIVIPRYGGKRGHPIIMNVRRYRDAILNLPEHVGLNTLIQEHGGDIHLVDVATDDIIRDIDYPADYARELARFSDRRSSV